MENGDAMFLDRGRFGGHHTVDGQILFAPPSRNPGMIRFPCKHQRTLVSAMVSKMVRSGFRSHPRRGFMFKLVR